VEAIAGTPHDMSRKIAAASVALLVALTATACDDDDDSVDDPADTVVDTLDDEPGVPFDPDVPGGVDTETDEQDNMGFDDDPGGEPGNVTDPVEVED